LALLHESKIGVPFSLATDLQTRTVHDKMHRDVRQAPGASADVYRSIPAGYSCVIWARKIQIHPF